MKTIEQSYTAAKSMNYGNYQLGEISTIVRQGHSHVSANISCRTSFKAYKTVEKSYPVLKA